MRWIYGGLQALLVAMMIWIGKTTVDTQVTLAGMRAELAALTAQTGDRYTRSQAESDWRHQALVDRQQQNELTQMSERYLTWTTRLSERLQGVEQTLRDAGVEPK